MLTFLVIALATLGACLLVCLLGALAALVIVLLWRDPQSSANAERPVPFVEDGGSSERRQYDRLAREMLQYASQPGVVYHQEVEASDAGYVFMRTTSDRFGRKRYVERQRRYANRLQCTLCLYENGDWIPTAHAIRDVPADKVEWNTYQQNVRDLRERGSKFSYWDVHGRHQQVRLPAKAVEVRV